MNESKAPYLCDRCGLKLYPVGSKFCSECGSDLKPYVRDVFDRRVLLVDDSLLSRRKIGAILKNMGCTVIEAINGEEALELVLESPPDLIVLDLEMPRKGGMETLAALRKDPRFAEMPVLILTAHANAETVTAAITNRANDFIRKDAPVKEIYERFKKHLSGLGKKK